MKHLGLDGFIDIRGVRLYSRDIALSRWCYENCSKAGFMLYCKLFSKILLCLVQLYFSALSMSLGLRIISLIFLSNIKLTSESVWNFGIKRPKILPITTKWCFTLFYWNFNLPWQQSMGYVHHHKQCHQWQLAVHLLLCADSDNPSNELFPINGIAISVLIDTKPSTSCVIDIWGLEPISSQWRWIGYDYSLMLDIWTF